MAQQNPENRQIRKMLDLLQYIIVIIYWITLIKTWDIETTNILALKTVLTMLLFGLNIAFIERTSHLIICILWGLCFALNLAALLVSLHIFT